ncbi:SDR family NAD(P)-dependent oxidoreductase [Saccharothrix sp. NRRL B-16314]|uniref:SDR family NAD(P)-dependent oxidoreductase n=1 Tax=Saccharothrix sp. NRRL B-16314 TaxID=1463825 RepID=UPI0006909BFB|nr:SDR family NAD(P)-dependent oxidoreductase [Saccharothrix sp. NRRL B-16314]
MSPRTGPVLITGCSSGIGRITAEHLLARGHVVCATARDPRSLTALARAGAETARLDVTDADMARDVVADLERRHGRIGALVNNAGYGEYGPVETVSLDRARQQFETNVLGLARMCQLVLPGMRRAGGGRIVNMSSIGGRMTFPGGGFYNASKYAVEAVSDALRFETAPFGVSVSVVEPNLIRNTRFEDHVSESLTSNTAVDGPYAGLLAAIRDQMHRCFDNDRMSTPPQAVARTVERALTDRSPRARYVVSIGGKLILASGRIFPSKSMDNILRRQFGLATDGSYTGKHAARRPDDKGDSIEVINQ